MIENVNSAGGTASISGDTITVENVGADQEDTLTITHNTSAADVVNGASYTITDAGDSTTDTATFNLVGATDVTAEAVDVTVSGDTAEVNVLHSDNPDQTEIALYDGGGNKVDDFDTTNDGSSTPGLDAVMTGNAGNTTFVLNTTELGNNYEYLLGTGTVYAASQSADDTFGTVTNANNQVQSDIDLLGLEVTGVEGPRSATNGTTLEYELTVTNTGSSSVNQSVDLVASDNDSTINFADPSTYTVYDSEFSGDVGSGNSTTVMLEVNSGDLNDAGQDVQQYEIGGFTNGSPASGQAQDLVVGSDSTGTITISVNDDTGAQREDVNVELWIEGDYDDQNKVIRNKTTNQNGDVVFSDLAVGSDSDNSIRYTARAGAAQEEFESTTTTLELYDDTQTSDSSTVTLQRNILPDRIEVEQSKTTAVADGEDQIKFTVTVYGDLNDEPFEGEEVNVRTTGESITFDPADQSLVTDENGQVVWNVSSDVVQDADFNFYAATADDPDDTSDPLVENRTKNFVLAGEGNLAGHVTNDATTNGVENASVWVVSQSSYTDNEFETTIDLTDAATNDDDDTVWIRLVDNETGEIIDNDDYDLRQGDVDGSGTHVRKVEDLNASDAAQGQGYALIDADDNDQIVFTHTSLEPDEYYAQVSLDAENASAQSDVLDIGTENFVNVSGVSGGTVDATGGSPVVFTPSTDLTLEATENLATFTGANYVDSPGFVNSYGYDTGGTTSDGRFALSQLPTDFQDGIGYVAITTKTGFTTDFADVTITEDGQLTFPENQGSNELFIEPVPVDPDGVGIQQVGTYEDASGTAQLINFTDASDDTFQEVPRDGSTVDVFVVNTTAEGTPVNATAEVSFADTSVAGNFVAIESGQYESRDNGTNTATISTGNDGQAVIWYQTDQNSTQTVDTRKTATLTNDESASDYSNVTFLPVLQAQSGEVSGIVTDSDNNPVPAVVYTKDLTVGNTVFTVEPAAADMSEFNITRYDGSGNAVESAIVTRSQAENYDFQTDKDGNPVFTSISLASSVSDLTLVTDSTSGVGEASSYTLPRVPTTDAGTNEVAVAATSQASIDSATSLSGLVTGQAVTTATEPNRTATSNVEISGAQAAQFTVSNLTVTPDSATPGETVTVEAEISNQGAVTDSAEVRYLFGDSIANATEQDSVTTAPIVTGESETVTFTLDTTGLDMGVYANLVETDDDSANADLTIGNGSNNGNWYDAYVNGTGVVEEDGLNAAISDYLSDDLDDTELNAVISSFLSGDPIADQ